MASLTYHLVAEPYYEVCDPEKPYVPERFDEEGFIHCTDGVDNLLATANRYYRYDYRRTWLVLAIDKEKVESEIKYEDAERVYPHIYGALNRDAIVSVLPVKRAEDGEFVALELVRP